jgi:hypothetical protein
VLVAQVSVFLLQLLKAPQTVFVAAIVAAAQQRLAAAAVNRHEAETEAAQVAARVAQA